MTKTEIRKLRVGSKYSYDSWLGGTKIRTVKFIVRDGKRKPMIVYYGVSYATRNEYKHLLSDKYKLIKL